MTAQAARIRRIRRRVDGVLLLDKPSGLSSNAALQRARRAFDAEKAGHTGTLDPLASGLLPLCFGEATKFAAFHLNARKRYCAQLAFGASTTTGDAEGDVVARSDRIPTCDEIHAALPAWRGPMQQIPPAYSALKFEGRKHYEYARAGIDVPRVSRAIEVHCLELLHCAPPLVTLDIQCSRGTYIRVLAEDIGAALGSRAHLAGLRRTGSGDFDVGRAVSLEELEALAPEQRISLLHPVDCLLSALPRLEVSGEDALLLQHGRRLPCASASEDRYRVYAFDGRFIGIARCEGGLLVPERLMKSGLPRGDAESVVPQAGRSE